MSIKFVSAYTNWFKNSPSTKKFSHSNPAADSCHGFIQYYIKSIKVNKIHFAKCKLVKKKNRPNMKKFNHYKVKKPQKGQ